MEKLRMQCSSCGANFAFPADILGQTRSCPKCGVELVLQAEGAVTASPALPEPGQYPERMRANKVLAGFTCGHCGKEIELGDDVHNCQECGTPMHESCFGDNDGCANPSCPMNANQQAPAAPQGGPASMIPPDPGGDTKECRYCGEQIKKNAKKCRFCGEYLDPRERKRLELRQQEQDGDDKLTAGEIVFGLLCGGIACIVSIVWMIQGKKKGWKLFLISLITQLVLALLQAAAES